MKPETQVGIMLGLIIVLIVDCIYRQFPPPTEYAPQETFHKSLEKHIMERPCVQFQWAETNIMLFPTNPRPNGLGFHDWDMVEMTNVTHKVVFGWMQKDGKIWLTDPGCTAMNHG